MKSFPLRYVRWTAEALGVCFIFLCRLLPDWGEMYARHLYPGLSAFLSALVSWIPFSMEECFFCSRVCTPCRTTAVGLEEKERVEVDLACRSRAAGRSVPLVLRGLGNQLFSERLLYAFLVRICSLPGFYLPSLSGRLYPSPESMPTRSAFSFARGHRERS